MRVLSLFCLAATACLATTPSALGHGIPVELMQSGGKLHTNSQVYTSSLALVAGIVLTTELPGFEIASTSQGIPANTTIGMNIMDRLWYWDGSDLVTPLSELTFENDFLDSVTVTGTSGFQSGPNIGTYNGSTGWHEHGFYTLEPVSAPIGAYGVVMQVKGGSFQPTDPFLVVFNHGLSAGAFQQGVDAITNEVFAVPEPSGFAMLGLGTAGLGALVARRQRSKVRVKSMTA